MLPKYVWLAIPLGDLPILVTDIEDKGLRILINVIVP